MFVSIAPNAECHTLIADEYARLFVPTKTTKKVLFGGAVGTISAA